MRKQIMISLPESFLKALDKYCEKKYMKRSEVVRIALGAFLAEEGEGWEHESKEEKM